MIANVRSIFRNGFYAGVLTAIILGLYLFQLWQPEKQIRLHTMHLISALEEKDWPDVILFIDPVYADDWGNDRKLLVARLQQVLPYARNLRIKTRRAWVRASKADGTWTAWITIEADPNEISEMIKERVNRLDEPFELAWRRGSGKPWDWKLVRVSNPALELSPGEGF